ncbi:MAG: ATP-binding cassette domain-containing protein [Candidatus Hydrogenedens sp.]|nr:ATP-binding cassette domain-containing protein [Candidatus Hydrogenedens sp.]
MTQANLEVVSNNAAIEAIRYVLQTHVMFSVLPTTEKRQLESLLEVRQYDGGKIIERQGRAIDGMYILYGGRARLKQQNDDKVVSIGVVSEGATLGEMSLLEDSEWAHDVVAEETTTVIVLPAAKARELIAHNKIIDEHFKRFVGLVKVGERLRTLLGHVRYTPEQFTEMLSELGVKRIKPDGAVFRQGENDPRLYYIESGIVELIRAPMSGAAISFGRVGRGALIGEGGALPRTGGAGMQPHTARAVNEVTVLVIYQKTVEKLLNLNAELAERLRQRIRELESFEQEELNIRRRAEGLDLRIQLADAITEEEFRSTAKVRKESVKFKAIKQEVEGNNAAACLTMIVNHYGRALPLNAIRAKTGLENAGTNLDEIIRGSENLGFRSKGYAIGYDDLKTALLPGIIGLEGYYYAVLVAISDREVQLADPRDGKVRRIAKDDFIRQWTAASVAGVTDKRPDAGVFIAMEPTQRFELEGIKKKNPIEYFIGYIMPYKGYFGEAILAALVINILGLASPLFIQSIVDTVVVHHDRSLLNMMLAGMVLVAVLTTLMTVVQSLLLAHTITRLDMRLMAEFYRHILSLPMPFFLSVNKGEILARFGENQKIRAILTGSSITTVMNMLMLTLYFFMMFAYSVRLTVIVIVFLPVFIAIVTYFTPRLKRISQEIFQAGTQAQASLIESLNGIEAIKATSNEYFARARWENAFVENVNRGFHQQRLALMNSSIFQLAILGMTTAVLWSGASQVIDGTMTVGELMGFNMLMGLVTNPVLQMVNLWSQLQEVRISVDRVGEYLEKEPEMEIVSTPDKMRMAVGQLDGLIEFKNINFSYRTGKDTKNIMENFNLVIQPGEKVAFVGPAGCGKSTIAKMVLGFNVPQSGQLTIDGKPVNQMDVSSLRRNIGVVLQDSFLFAGTVAENIAFGDPEPDMQTVQEVARLAGAEEFIIRLPLGYQTLIGEKGQALSGGQRQRVCIARALYRRPRIMIFDEATSALDNQTEEGIIKQLKEKVLPGRTSISIAHRLTTIMNSDRICFIRDGIVQEHGTHHQLIDPIYIREQGYKGLYYNLAKTQFDLPAVEF